MTIEGFAATEIWMKRRVKAYGLRLIFGVALVFRAVDPASPQRRVTHPEPPPSRL